MATYQTIIDVLIAAEIGAQPEQVSAAVELLDGGATVPFVARYRKEVTGGLDDTQLRNLETRLAQLRALDARRASVLKSISEQGKLTPELETAVSRAGTMAELEDVYLPYRQKRRSKADVAKEKGLGPLAEAILADRSLDPAAIAVTYLNADVADVKAALDGARDIVVEAMAENAPMLSEIRARVTSVGRVRAKVIEGKEAEGAKFSDYFDHVEKFADAPSHRVLALMRARDAGIVHLDVEVDAEDESPVKPVEAIVARHYGIGAGGPGDAWMMTVAKWAWRIRIHLGMAAGMMVSMKEKADEEAIRVFSRNLKDLLLAAPAGAKVTMGLDPGIRTGVKVAVVDATGKLVETATVYPFQPRNDVQGASLELASLMRKHGVGLIAIGNGTASRETEKLAGDVIAALPGAKPVRVVVSEAGASIYSASEVAALEMPGVDVSLRGAVSIARRLQDPLAELVKIDPKAIGVGQYQHDVDQYKLAKGLDAVVEDAVNSVGVDLNMASAPLLSRVSGVGPSLADAIVRHREANGAFRTRRSLLEVSRLGPKAFEQCAGFLRIRDGDEPLDASAVHPESYPVARRIVESTGRQVRELMGDPAAMKKVVPAKFVSEADGVGLPTVRDIVAELEKPGRDPRPAFKAAKFNDDVHQISDLKPGMMLEGTVSNVAAFGAFVDIGVHQDGLVHVSQLADRFVRNAEEVVKVGQVVTVRVVEVDAPRKRIALSMRTATSEAQPDARRPSSPQVRGPAAKAAMKPEPVANNAFGAALAAAMKRK